MEYECRTISHFCNKNRKADHIRNGQRWKEFGVQMDLCTNRYVNVQIKQADGKVNDK